MGQLIKPQHVKVVTKDGECQVSISLELTINLNTDGVVVSQAKERQSVKDDTHWAIPDFTPSAKINFGKKE